MMDAREKEVMSAVLGQALSRYLCLACGNEAPLCETCAAWSAVTEQAEAFLAAPPTDSERGEVDRKLAAISAEVVRMYEKHGFKSIAEVGAYHAKVRALVEAAEAFRGAVTRDSVERGTPVPRDGCGCDNCATYIGLSDALAALTGGK